MKAALLGLTLLLLAGPARAAPSVADIDAAAVSVFEAAQHAKGTVIVHLDLTRPFKTRTPWAFVAVQGPKVKSDGDEQAPGRIFLCLAHGTQMDCQTPTFPKSASLYDAIDRGWNTDKPDLYGFDAPHYLNAEVVNLKGTPRLVLTTSSVLGISDYLTTTFVLGYVHASDRFVGQFAGALGHNNNQRIRIVEIGPLAGSIITDDPTPNAPFAYFVTVYQPSREGLYVARLRYRSRTGYNDGNPLSVIDAEMPEILRRLNMWKVGDSLPQPLERPAGCKSLELRHGVEWCR
jgi:hypothetical protein